MSKRQGGGKRNRYPARNQADNEPYRTQDERPDYKRGRVPEERDGERRDVEDARTQVEDERQTDRQKRG